MRLFIARIVCAPLVAALAFGAAVLPLVVGAQTLPSYARPGSGPTTSGETIHGVIEAIQGPYRILIRDDRGFVDDVTLRQGTVINPRGLRLAVGMSVTIYGLAAGSTFSALEIDTPYDYDTSPSGSTYYGGYPAYDYGYGQNYGGFYGQYYEGFPFGSVTVIEQPVVVPPPPVGRRIPPPSPGYPWRRPLDGKNDPSPYGVPPTTYRAPSVPDRAPAAPDRAQAHAPQYRAPAPEYHAPPPPPRSEPAPVRENRQPPSNPRPH